MKKIITILAFIVCAHTAHADRYIQPTKYDDQEEVLVQGASVIVSNKTNAVTMYQTCETTKNRKGSFYFIIDNYLEKPINFYFSDLKVTDQHGHPIRVVHKNEIIQSKDRERFWSSLGSAFIYGSDLMNAQDAGTITYQEHTHSHYHSNFRVKESNGRVSNTVTGRISGDHSSSTHGVVYSEALRQRALHDADFRANIRNQNIQANYDNWMDALNNFYFDSSTIFPNTFYEANVQIEIPKAIENDLEYILFTFNVGGEEHVFCFYCGTKVKGWF